MLCVFGPKHKKQFYFFVGKQFATSLISIET